MMLWPRHAPRRRGRGDAATGRQRVSAGPRGLNGGRVHGGQGERRNLLIKRIRIGPSGRGPPPGSRCVRAWRLDRPLRRSPVHPLGRRARSPPRARRRPTLARTTRRGAGWCARGRPWASTLASLPACPGCMRTWWPGSAPGASATSDSPSVSATARPAWRSRSASRADSPSACRRPVVPDAVGRPERRGTRPGIRGDWQSSPWGAAGLATGVLLRRQFSEPLRQSGRWRRRRTRIRWLARRAPCWPTSTRSCGGSTG